MQLALGGGSTAIAATAVYKAMTYYFEQGEIPRDMMEGMPDPAELMDQPRYDDVVRKWAQATGRPLRPAPEE
jgi:hypothetical protein